MGTISKISGRCQDCLCRDKCDHKKMEACEYIDKRQLARSAAMEAGVSAAAPVLRETMQINVGGVMTIVDKLPAKLRYNIGNWEG